MKHLLLLPLLSVLILQGNGPLRSIEKNIKANDQPVYADDHNKAMGLNLQPDPGNEKMSAAEFKKQEYCYAELKDFDFDAHFSIISATVYFSGTNFRGVESGTINGPSLKPLNNLKAKCAPGTIVIFDNVKVKGPDQLIRTIKGTTIMLQ